MAAPWNQPPARCGRPGAPALAVLLRLPAFQGALRVAASEEPSGTLPAPRRASPGRGPRVGPRGDCVPPWLGLPCVVVLGSHFSEGDAEGGLTPRFWPACLVPW